MTAFSLIFEIGVDMSVFPRLESMWDPKSGHRPERDDQIEKLSAAPTAKNLVSWAGCCPRNDTSNRTVKSTRISKAGSYLKPLLVQIANAAISFRDHPEFGIRYRRFKAHRGHKKAIIAICKMLLTAIWNILSKRKPDSTDGYVVPQPSFVAKPPSESQWLALLRQLGHSIKDDDTPPITA